MSEDYVRRVTSVENPNIQFTLFYDSRCALSNFNRSPFWLHNIKYECVEQYFQYSKAVYFGDKKTANAILAAKYPGEQKQLGRGIIAYDEERWKFARDGIMTQGLHAKFEQNPEHQAVLMRTCGTTLAEASPTDSIWGIGFSSTDPRAADPSLWGENKLGRLLEEVRSFIKYQQMQSDNYNY